MFKLTKVGNIGNAITRFGGRVWLKARGHAPEILFVAGCIGFGLTIASAIKDTMTVEPILDEHIDKAEAIKAKVEANEIEPAVAKKATRDIYGHTALRFAKHYGKTMVAAGLTMAAFGGSFSIMRGRYVGAMSLAAATARSYEQYRARVKADQGEEKDMEYFTGKKSEDCGYEVTTDDGKGNVATEVCKDLRRYCDMAELESNLGYDIILSSADDPYFFDENDLKGTENRIMTQVRYGNDILMRIRGWFGLDEFLKSINKQVTITSKALAWRKENGPITCDIQRIWYQDMLGMSHPAMILHLNINPELMAIEDLPIPKI